jgi:hypothetical protein
MAEGAAEAYYEEEGEHGRAGYYVKTVGNAPVAKPTALSSAEAASLAACSDGGSAWNSGGTWEDQDLSKWAKAGALAELLCGLSLPRVRISKAEMTAGRSVIYCVFPPGKPSARYTGA